MKSRRILLIAVAGLVLLVGGLVLTVALIPEERVANAVAQQAEEVLGEPVAIDRVGLAIFPLPGVRLSDLTVGDPADSMALARVDRAEVRVRILPLFRGRVVVRTLDLDAPRIAVEIDSGGVSNFPTIERDTTAEPASRDVSFAIDDIRITDGSLRYINHEDGTRVVLTGWNQELAVAGAVEEGELATLTLTGRVGFDDVEATLPGAVLPTRNLSLEVRHDASLDLDADRLELREMEVDFDGVTMAGSGRVLGVNSGRPAVSLELGAEGLNAARLLAWVPDSLRSRLELPDGRPIGLAGTASMQATVNGTVAPDTLPAVDGTLQLTDVAINVGSDPVLDGISGDVEFSLDSVVARFDGRMLGQSFNAGVAVRDPSAPLAVVALSGRADLGRLAPLGLVSDTLELDGAVRIDLRVQVPVDAPADARAVGTIDASRVAVAGADPAVRVPTATASFDGGRVRVNPFRIELGPERSPIELDVTADGWIPAALDSSAPLPQVAVVMEAGTLDLDALLGPSEIGYPALLFARLRDRSINGRDVDEVADEMGLGIPALPAADLRVEARIAELIRNDLHYSDMDVAARVTPETATLEQLRFGLMGGVVNVSGLMDPLATDSGGTPLETRLTGRVGLTNVGAGPFFDLLTPFRDHLAGRLDMATTFGMTLDRFALPHRSSVETDGTLGISDGRMANWAVLRGVAERLGVAAFDTVRFQDWVGRFHIDGTRVSLDETALEGTRLSALADGWFDFGGQLDVQVTASLTPELAEQAGAIARQLVAAAPDGGLPVGLRIHGLVESPAVTLDLAPARDAVAARASEAADDAAQQAEDRVREAAQTVEDSVRDVADDAAARARGQVEDEARAAADRATQEAAGQVELPDSLRGLPADSLRKILGDSTYALLPDSVKLRADSLQQAIENSIRDRLRRLLPGGGGGDGGGGQ